MISLNVNGKSHQLDINPDMPLLWALRDKLNLTGTKYGCGHAMCGACVVHVDGEAVRSCSIMAGEVAGKKITTVEGVSGKVADAVTKAWQQLDVVQCGYCQSGQIMQAASLLAKTPKPSRAQIIQALNGNLCRCGTYGRIVRAVERAARGEV